MRFENAPHRIPEFLLQQANGQGYQESLERPNENKKSSGSPEFFKKYSLACAPWCILRLPGAQVPHIPL